jgi:hypothetical protein
MASFSLRAMRVTGGSFAKRLSVCRVSSASRAYSTNGSSTTSVCVSATTRIASSICSSTVHRQFSSAVPAAGAATAAFSSMNSVSGASARVSVRTMNRPDTANTLFCSLNTTSGVQKMQTQQERPQLSSGGGWCAGATSALTADGSTSGQTHANGPAVGLISCGDDEDEPV